MPETGDLLTTLRDVGVTKPEAGDAGDEHVRIALQREIAGRRRADRRRRTVLCCSALGAAAAVAAGVVVATGAVDGAKSSAPQTSAGPMPQARETADIVRRVRTDLAHLAIAGQGRVLERTIGDGTPGRPIV